MDEYLPTRALSVPVSAPPRPAIARQTSRPWEPSSWTSTAASLEDRPRTDAEICRVALTAAAVEPGAFRRALAASTAFVIGFQTRTGGGPAPRRADGLFTRHLDAGGRPRKPAA